MAMLPESSVIMARVLVNSGGAYCMCSKISGQRPPLMTARLMTAGPLTATCTNKQHRQFVVAWHTDGMGMEAARMHLQ